MKKILRISISLGIFSFSTISFASARSPNVDLNPSTDCLMPYCDTIQTDKGVIEVHPIEHASFVLTYQNEASDSDHPFTIVVDPVDHLDELKSFRPVDIILVTDINTIMEADTTLIVPESVAREKDFPEFFAGTIKIMNNDEQDDVDDIHIKAMPMYNTDPDRDFHPKGRGNGYVLSIDGKKIYISGDTQYIPEMDELTDIDAAFVVMNMPFTMDVNEAAQAVLAIKPKVVYPYHYRNGNGKYTPYANVQGFMAQVSRQDPNIQEHLLTWYPNPGRQNSNGQENSNGNRKNS
jgi:L-ascorbate metabolism protein UlaG (beta-lactamase superfamily)